MIMTGYARYAARDDVPAGPCNLHGINLADCPSCAKIGNQCDYGSCEAEATTVYVRTGEADAREHRPACQRHAELMAKLDGQAEATDAQLWARGVID